MMTVPSHALAPVTVAKPVGCVNVAASGAPSELVAAVVTRILYVVPANKRKNGTSVAIVLPPDITAVGVTNGMHCSKLFEDTWIAPLHEPSAVCPVSDAGFIAVVNVTEIVEDVSTFAAPSAGVVL